MSTIYLLGGPPRTAKSTIALSVISQQAMPLISSDAVKAGWRNMLIGDPQQMLRSIEFEGQAEYKASVTGGGDKKPFSRQTNSEELTKLALLGIISSYLETDTDILIEGDTVTPNWAIELSKQGYIVRAAFVGYTDIRHIDTILAHAAENHNDWINGWLAAEHGDDTGIRSALTKQAKECQQLKIDAELHGFSFFDISELQFQDYLANVSNYLLG